MSSSARAPRSVVCVSSPWVFALGALLLSCAPTTLQASQGTSAGNLGAARALDQQGVLAFEAARYRDALLYFDAAFAHGGPSSERWNAAKCHMRLGEPEQAEAELEAYLAVADLTREDRREGEATLASLRRAPSTLTVLSSPLGLPVSVDGHHVGTTPATVMLAPGDHVVAVSGARVRDEHVVSARLGRALLIEARP